MAESDVQTSGDAPLAIPAESTDRNRGTSIDIPDECPNELLVRWIVFARTATVGKFVLTEVASANTIGPNQAILSAVEADPVGLGSKELIALPEHGLKPAKVIIRHVVNIATP